MAQKKKKRGGQTRGKIIGNSNVQKFPESNRCITIIIRREITNPWSSGNQPA